MIDGEKQNNWSLEGKKNIIQAAALKRTFMKDDVLQSFIQFLSDLAAVVQ